MNNKISDELNDLIIVSNNLIKTYRKIGNFYDTNDGIFYYIDEYENCNSKVDFLNKLNYCELIYTLHYWRENNCVEYSNLSTEYMEAFSGIYDEETCELSNLFFEFEWSNPFCDIEKIEWNPDRTWGICPEGNVFLLHSEWDTHTLFIETNKYDDFTSILNQIKTEIINFIRINLS